MAADGHNRALDLLLRAQQLNVDFLSRVQPFREAGYQRQAICPHERHDDPSSPLYGRGHHLFPNAAQPHPQVFVLADR